MLTYLLLFPERDDAEKVAEDLAEDSLGEVRVVREALAGEDDSESHEWGVYVQIDTIDDPSSALAKALTERFTAVAHEYDGWLDQHP
ncbi:ribonuclease E inhibitor RraB [Luteipulveratus halotolerans]|uniref:ribonuclease E inhibitor RraB n=1 Tax=Luteipulveratus halotolerans TaxID=1631356 RepID=UPI0006828944|nr:ribonuclease E inhibitor RraB [Luteipulveratus halotolerans]